VFTTSRNETINGSVLASSLIDEILTGSSGLSRFEVPVTRSTLAYDTGKLLGVGVFEPTHDTLNLSGTGVAIKTLTHVTADNSVANLQFTYKEMVYDSGADANDVTEVTNAASFSVVTGGLYHIVDSNAAWNGRVVVRVGGASSNANITSGSYGIDVNNTLTFNNVPADGTWESWDGNGWGDNNQFEIANGSNVGTDDNANAVKYGIAKFKPSVVQYFVKEK